MFPPLSTRRSGYLALGALSFLASGGFAWWYLHEPDDPPFSVERYLLPQAPIREVLARPLSEVGGLLAPADPVLGVTIGRESRAYPLRLLGADPQRKVLNDRLGGHSIAATW